MRLIGLMAAALLTAACGSSGPEWQAAYIEEIDEQWANTPATDQTQACAAVETLSDEELEAAIVASIPSEVDASSAFGRVMLAEGIEPTRQDIELAVDIALDRAKANCE